MRKEVKFVSRAKKIIIALKNFRFGATFPNGKECLQAFT